MIRSARLAGIAMLIALAAGGAAVTAEPRAFHPAEVHTAGTAQLRKCRDWMMFEHCKLFNRIAIPETIRIGDEFEVLYSSNNKTFRFIVRDILMFDDECRIFDEVANPHDDPELEVDSLIATPCTALR